jgi:type IV pilus assembly protein PilX
MNRRPSAGAQQGAALVTVLVLLLVMTLLGIVSLRSTLLEERMASNQRDRSLSFQAAEAALRAGELFVRLPHTVPPSGCTEGVCGFPDTLAAPVWEDENVWDAIPTAAVSIEGAPDAKFLVELLADEVPAQACPNSIDPDAPPCAGTERRYRITARSEAEGRATVMLQSIYAL